MAKGKRKVKAAADTKPLGDINVTPLVDIVLVMLIIFMVVTPLIEKDIEIKVPDTEKTEDVTEVPPDQIVVGLTPAGEISINMEKIPDADYVAKLRRILNAKHKGDRLVFFMPDAKTNYAKVVAALDGVLVASLLQPAATRRAYVATSTEQLLTALGPHPQDTSPAPAD